MRRLVSAWRTLFDVRPGEYRRTMFMSLYLLFVLFAYYVLKAASESMFLNKFDIDKLPNLYILMAIFGGALAYVYSKVAARTSLHTAVTWTMFLSFACLLLMWYPLRARNPTMVYVFAVWVRLFSIVTVTQGWVVATNLFNAREAKRLYGLLGMGMIVGAVFGGEFTAELVRFIGTDNLLFASAPLVIVAYGCYLAAISRVPTVMHERAAEGEAAHFSFGEVVSDIGRSRHLQVLVLLMALQFIMDTLIDYQFKLEAKAAFKGDALTAFLGRFYGRYLNAAELILQFFFTTAVVRRLGIGGTLQIMPVSLAAASLFTFASPSVLSASLARLVEASTRYTLTRTGNELFYMPLPLELRNRIKAFIDIFMDRAARGISGFLLLLFVHLSIGVRGIALFSFLVALPWMALTVRAHREYVRTLRRRLESRALDFESARISVEDDETIRLLERTARSPNARQAVYGLSLLAESPRYDLQPLLLELADSPSEDVRAQVYRLARARKNAALTERARGEVERAGSAAGASPYQDMVREAIAYLAAVSPEGDALARQWLDDSNASVREGVVEYLCTNSSSDSITDDWLKRAATDDRPAWRTMAARLAICRPAQAADIVQTLLADRDPLVVRAACRTAGMLKNAKYVFTLAKLLADPRVRGSAIEALAQYGPAICGTVGDIIADPAMPLHVRVNIPRVLKRIPDQRSVDVLLHAYKLDERDIRIQSLKALSRLRNAAPKLSFDDSLLNPYIQTEVHTQYELLAAMASIEEYSDRQHSPISLLARTVQSRIDESIDRLFRLLALRYEPREMYSIYRAVAKGDKDKHVAGIELLDNTLDQGLKRVVLPLFDAPERRVEAGRSVFKVEPRVAEETLRTLTHSQDQWLAACAIAAIAELKLRSLAKDVREQMQNRNPDVRKIASETAAALAG